MKQRPDAKSFGSYDDLSAHYARGKDYEVAIETRPDSPIVVIAPHAGMIENGTSEIARAIVENDFNIYLFEGVVKSGNYRALHLTSHYFNEPDCVEFVLVKRSL